MRYEPATELMVGEGARQAGRRPRGAGCACAAALVAVLGAVALPATAAAQEDPGGDANAPVPVPPPGQHFGLNADAVVPGHGISTERLAELAHTTGANAIRSPLNWSGVEPQRDGWSDGTWAEYDRFYRAAIAAELTPIMVLGNAPWWARTVVGQLLCLSNAGCRYPPAPWMDGEWEQFAREAARRYPQAIFQIWNEPNLASQWGPWPEPVRYAQVQIRAYAAIKSVNPGALVLSGGFANAHRTTPLSTIAMREFVDSAYSGSTSIKGHMDALAFHPFPGPSAASYTGEPPNLGAGSGFARGFAEIRDVRDRWGDSGTPLFITETGISTTEGVTRAEQTAATRRIYRKTLTMDDVIGVVLHRLDEPPSEIANAFELGAAWLRTSSGDPPEPYPVYCGFVADAGNSYAGC